MHGTILEVTDIPAAVRAVEAARHGRSRYVEINASADGVNVFVADSPTTEVAYFYAGGKLQPPGAPEAQASPPFDLGTIDPAVGARLVQQTQDHFPGATVTEVALLEVGDQGLRWALRSRSSRGGLLDSFYTPNGELASVAPAPSQPAVP